MIWLRLIGHWKIQASPWAVFFLITSAEILSNFQEATSEAGEIHYLPYNIKHHVGSSVWAEESENSIRIKRPRHDRPTSEDFGNALPTRDRLSALFPMNPTLSDNGEKQQEGFGTHMDCYHPTLLLETWNTPNLLGGFRLDQNQDASMGLDRLEDVWVSFGFSAGSDKGAENAQSNSQMVTNLGEAQHFQPQGFPNIPKSATSSTNDCARREREYLEHVLDDRADLEDTSSFLLEDQEPLSTASGIPARYQGPTAVCIAHSALSHPEKNGGPSSHDDTHSQRLPKGIIDFPQRDEHNNLTQDRKGFSRDIGQPSLNLLSKYSFSPPRSMRRGALDRYLLPYKNRMDEVFRKELGPVSVSEKRLFRGISAAEVIFKGGHSVQRMIRVLTPWKSLLTPSKITTYLMLLLTWLYFNHEAFLEKTQTSIHMRPDAQQRIFDWLKKEFFSPEQSLPVTGHVICDITFYNEREFEPVQRWMIDYLSAENPYHCACTTSAAIIAIWYKNFQSNFWQRKFGDDNQFWSFINQQTFLNPIPPQEVHEVGNHPQDSEQRKLGNFQIFKKYNFSLSSLPYIKMAFIPKDMIAMNFKLEDEMVQNMQLALGEAKIELKHHKSYFKDISIAAIRTRGITRKPSGKFYVLRLLDSLKNIIQPSKLKLKILSLLRRLKYYHGILGELTGLKAQYFIERHKDLLSWLKHEFFSPEESFPVFGKVTMGLQMKEKDYFGEIQMFLINYLTKTSGRTEGDQAALSLLGYWYKSKYVDFWKSNFVNDIDYWKLMACAKQWDKNILSLDKMTQKFDEK